MSKPFEGFHIPNTTPVPDILFDELLHTLTGNELKVLLYIIRRTYGFGKTADAISLSQFREGIKTKDGKKLDQGCGIAHNRTILVALTSLEKRDYITSKKRKTLAGDDATTVYQLHLKSPIEAHGDDEVVTPGNDGSYFRSRRQLPQVTTVVTSGNPQETVLQETVLQETVLQEEGEQEQQQAKTHARSLSNISSSLSLVDDLPENVSSFSKPPEQKETVQLTEKQRRRAEEEGRRARETEIWAIVEEGRKTTYSSRQRTGKKHMDGLSGLIEDGVADTTIRHGLSVLSEWEKEAFCLNAFYEWLPNLRTRVPGTIGRHLKAVVNGNNNHTNGNHYSTMTMTTDPDAYINPHYGAPPGMLFWKGQLVTEDDAYADGYNGGFERYK